MKKSVEKRQTKTRIEQKCEDELQMEMRKKVGELERTDPKSQTRFSTNLNSWHTKYSKKKYI